MKFFTILFLLLFIYACSLDTKSGIWNEDDKKKQKKISSSTDDQNLNLTFENYKLLVIEYGKKSKFPDININ